MVSTRKHPDEFPAPVPSTPAPKTPSKRFSPAVAPTAPRAESQHQDSSNSPKPWSHTPSLLTLAWLCISLPLVIWDALYVILRPHSMPGGKYQKPLWIPYELYGQVDYIYGWPAYNSGNGFTAAQMALNVVETAGYICYLYLVYTHGKTENVQGTGAPDSQHAGKLSWSRTVHGKVAARALIILYGIALMTLSKTVLYWLNEVFSGFANIGHNSLSSLVFLWIIPNGAWIILPIYLVYVSGKEIIGGLETATGDVKKSQ